MTDLNKPAIKRMVLDLRHLLEEDITAVLRQYGLFADRDWLPADKVRPHLREARDRMEATMLPEVERIGAHEKSPARARQQAAYWYIREVAFTYLNRLVGLKCLEVRGLFPEVVQTREAYSGRSLYHRDYLAAHPDLSAQADDGLPTMLAAACQEVTQQVRTLFDPASDSSIVWPRYDALRRAIGLVNDLPLDHWQQDEIIGWIYQFYNAEEKEQIRKRGKPTLPIEVAIINQFFTPRWIVKFLVDNTLGRLWLEMHPDSPRVRAICDYLVPEPLADQEADNGEQEAARFRLDESSPINNPAAAPRREPKPPQHIRLIDPACGAMHFGHYAFEVFTAIYQDAREQGYVPPSAALSDQDIPLAILHHNLYGVDIDLRAVQLAALALYLKARVALRNLDVSDEHALALPWRVNLVCADARLPADGLRDQFLQHYEDDEKLKDAWRELFKEMEDIAQVGSLLRVEQRFRAILEQHRPASVRLNEQRQGYLEGMEPQAQQLSFGDAPDAGTWTPRHSLETMLEHLKEFARHALDTADVNAQLFATEAEKTLGLLDVLMQSYDVVVMNPPYGDQQTDDLKQYLTVSYKDTQIDSGMSFVTRGIELSQACDGLLGALTPRSFMYLTYFKKFRESLFLRKRPPCLLELGIGVLDDATVRTAAFVLERTNGHVSPAPIFWDLTESNQKALDFDQSYRQLKNQGRLNNSYIVSWDALKRLPGMSLSYNAPQAVLRQFSRFSFLDKEVAGSDEKTKIADVKVGLQTGGDELFVRYFWEVQVDQVRWRSFSKGGDFSPYYRDFELVVNWFNNGYAIKNHYDDKGKLKSRPQNSGFYGLEGLTYPATSERGMGVHYMPPGTIISVKGSGVYPQHIADLWYLLAFLNSNLCWAFMGVFTADREHQVGMVARFPTALPALHMQRDIGAKAREYHDLKAAWDTGNEICTRFDKPWLLSALEQGAGSISAALDDLARQEQQHDTRLQAIQCEIDDAVYTLYEISTADRALIERELGQRPPELVWPQMEGKSRAEKHKEHVRRLLSYFLLRALRADEDGLIPLVAGSSHPIALDRLRNELAAQFSEEAVFRLEDEATQVLGRPLERWLDGDFIQWHTKLYKKRPIVWQLTSERGSFACLLYYHRLSRDTLPKLRQVYLTPMQRGVETLASNARDTGDRATASTAEATADELRVFDDKLAAIIAAGYDPVIDDGVKKNILPLQEAGLLRYKVV